MLLYKRGQRGCINKKSQYGEGLRFILCRPTHIEKFMVCLILYFVILERRTATCRLLYSDPEQEKEDIFKARIIYLPNYCFASPSSLRHL